MQKKVLNEILFNTLNTIDSNKEDINQYKSIINNLLKAGANFETCQSTKDVPAVFYFFNNTEILEFIYNTNEKLCMTTHDGKTPFEYHIRKVNPNSAILQFRLNKKISADNLILVANHPLSDDIKETVFLNADISNYSLIELINNEKFQKIANNNNNILNKIQNLFKKEDNNVFSLSLEALTKFSTIIPNINQQDKRGDTPIYRHIERIKDIMDAFESELALFKRKEQKIMKHVDQYTRDWLQGSHANSGYRDECYYSELGDRLDFLNKSSTKSLENALDDFLAKNTESTIATKVKNEFILLNNLFTTTSVNLTIDNKKNENAHSLLTKTWEQFKNSKYICYLKEEEQEEIKIIMTTMLHLKKQTNKNISKI